MSGIKHLLGDEGYVPPTPPKRIAYQETSREAWRRFVPISADLDYAIMLAIEAAGPDGIICHAIETKIGRSHQSVSGNLRHLVERGLVEPSGRKDKTPSNRPAICWRVKVPA